MTGLTDFDRYRSLAAAIACVSVFAVTTAFVSPLISLILESRGASRTVIGAMASVPALAIVVTSPFVPKLVVWLGIQRFIVVCIIFEFALLLLLPIFDSITSWFVIRALMGASGAGLFIASETWINEVALERSRGRVIAVYAMIISGSFALGPLVIPFAGIKGWAPFLVGAVFIALAALPLFWAGRLSPTLQGKSSFGVFAFLFIAPTLAAGIWVSAFKEMAIGALLPVYGVRTGLTDGEAAMMLTAAAVGALLFQFPLGWLIDKVNRYGVLIGCAIVGALGIALLPTMVSAGGVWLWVGLCAWGGIFSGVYTASMAIVGQRFRGQELVTANAALGFLWGLGALMGPTTAGVAMDIWDPNGLPGTIVVLTALFVLFAVVRRVYVRFGTKSRNKSKKS